MPKDMAIDCHQRRRFVLACDPQGTERWHRRYPTTAAGEADLLGQVEPGDRVVLEATSGAFRLANQLERVGATVFVADPQQARLLGMRGKKSDYRDCRALLRHFRAGELVAVWRPDAATRQTRQLARERHAYNQGIVRLKNRVLALLREEGLQPPEALWGAAGRAWLAEQSLPATTRGILERELNALAAMGEAKEKQRVALVGCALEQPVVERLLQIPGFGVASAVMVVGEVGDFHRFARGDQLASYAGLDPRIHDSDGKGYGGGVSKGGRSLLRWVMVEVAWAHLRAGGGEAVKYHHWRKRGKPEGVAITALARHLLVVAHRLVTRAENYRTLPAERYEAKLRQLAAGRTWTEAPQATNVDWAAERFEATTGEPSPHRRQRPESATTRRRVRRVSKGPGRRATPTRRSGAPNSLL
jgi:transposase